MTTTKPKAKAKTPEDDGGSALFDELILKAYDDSLTRIQKDASLNAASSSAGFIFDPGQREGKRHGLQVFVKIIRYSDGWLARAPHNGGLAVRP